MTTKKIRRHEEKTRQKCYYPRFFIVEAAAGAQIGSVRDQKGPVDDLFVCLASLDAALCPRDEKFFFLY